MQQQHLQHLQQPQAMAPYPIYALPQQPQLLQQPPPQQPAYYLPAQPLLQPAPMPLPQQQQQQQQQQQHSYYGAPLTPSGAAAYLPAPPLPYYAPQLHPQQQQQQQQVTFAGPPLEAQGQQARYPQSQPSGGSAPQHSLSAAVNSYLTPGGGDGRGRGQSAGALAAAELRQGSGGMGAYGH
jgi:hypothetical protein